MHGCILPGQFAGLAATTLLSGLGQGEPIEELLDASTRPDAVVGSSMILVAWRAVSDR